jgi:hypothetical protein
MSDKIQQRIHQTALMESPGLFFFGRYFIAASITFYVINLFR